MPDEAGSPTIPERVERADRAIAAYSGHHAVELNTDDVMAAISDLISDLHHLCDSLDVPGQNSYAESAERWDRLLSTSDMNHHAEVTGIEP